MPKREPTQAQLAKMPNWKLKNKGYVRIPGFTKADGTKVKAHIRKLRPSDFENKQRSRPLSDKQRSKAEAKQASIAKDIEKYSEVYVNTLNAQISPNLERAEAMTDNMVTKAYYKDRKIKDTSVIADKYFLDAGKAVKKLNSALGKYERVSAKLNNEVANKRALNKTVGSKKQKVLDKHNKLSALVFGAASALHWKASDASKDKIRGTKTAERLYQKAIKKLIVDYNKK